jgi:two-component system sensor histidine kinase DesK
VTGVARGRFFWLWAGIWLVYLIEPLAQTWQEDTGAVRVLGVVVVVLFAVVFVAFLTLLRHARLAGKAVPHPLGWAAVGTLAALTVAITPAIGESALGMLAFVAVTALFSLPRRPALIICGLLIAAPVAVPAAIPGWEVRYDLSFSIMLACLVVFGVIQVLQRNSELAAAHQEIARLAVVDERNRFARDLHDLLGHSLTVVAVKAELAGRLVRLAPERAENEIGDVERLARQALRDVRAAVAGYVEVALAAELAGARAALDAAGIEADLPDDVDAVPAARRELFGWVVREGVTNVVRHSGAKRCHIRVTPSQIEITDDGGGAAASSGRGLAGLGERVAAAGGSLAVSSVPGQGFTLRVRVP